MPSIDRAASSPRSTNPDELPDVQVWHPKDTIVMARQKLDARRERERSMLAAWSVADGRWFASRRRSARKRRRSNILAARSSSTPTRLRWNAASVASTQRVELRSRLRPEDSKSAQRIEDRTLQSSPAASSCST
jgi:hypothetical protein